MAAVSKVSKVRTPAQPQRQRPYASALQASTLHASALHASAPLDASTRHRRVQLRHADPGAVRRARAAAAAGGHRRRLSGAFRPQAAERGSMARADLAVP